MGAQHQGVLDIPGCVGYNETLCEMMTKLLAVGAYAPIIRDSLIQAQYFKDPYNITAYLEFNPFLPDINNERAVKNASYVQ
jgi:palmitoyl-protein thioesterase